MSSPNAVCVYAGSGLGARDDYRDSAFHLAEAIAERDLALVYGGAALGLMGVLADRALELEVTVTGVISRSLIDREGAHTGLDDLRVVDSLHERKQLMSKLSSGFVAVPGGVGTLEEFIETFSWLGLGIHAKPVGLLNVCGYWSGLLRQIDHAVAEGFVRPAQLDLLVCEDDAGRLLDGMRISGQR